ncbi:hypothetical protein BDR05DRAFT_611268 [Suillus weaverae]|nr:hypothetical protein BDR05DRAFT_611268 [Suillus weaverae]
MIQAYEVTDKNGPRSKSNRTSYYVSGSASKAEESARTWIPRCLQACSKNTPKIALEMSSRHHQRLELSWCSSSRGVILIYHLRNKIYFDSIKDFHFCLILHCNTYFNH